MESNNWRPAQGDSASIEAPSADWRSQLQPDARQRIVNKIMDTLRRHLPVAVPEGMSELKKIALRFEDKIFSAAVNQSDYLRKISLKMLSMETKTQHNTSMNSQPGVSQNSSDTGLLSGPAQMNNQGQPLSQIPMVSQPSGRQQLLSQNLPNNTPATMQGSSNLSASPSVTGLNQSTLTNYGHTNNMQNMPGLSHSSVNIAQGTTDIYGNAQRQMQGRQHQQSILSQQQQSQNPLLYQNQLQSQPQLIKPKIHNTAHMQSMQQQLQQQQSLLQTNQMQPSQQSVMQMPSGLSSGQASIQQSQATAIQSAPQPSHQPNQLNSMQQSVTSLLPQHVQAMSRQSQQPLSSIHQQTSMQQQSAAIHQQSNLQQQQQQQLLGQQANMSNIQQASMSNIQQASMSNIQQANMSNIQVNMSNIQQANMSGIQQNQLLGQPNNIVDIKQQQQQRLPNQQNSLVNLQQSQQLLNQQTLSLHQQQLGQQTNMQGLQQQQPQSQQQQQQLLGSLQNVSNMQPHQRSMQLLQQSKTMSQTQQPLQQPSMTLLQSQGQQTHLLSSQQQMMPQFQSQPGQLQQPLSMQQQPNSMQREMQQRLQIPGTLLQSQTTMEQQKPFMQSQRGVPEVSSSTSIDSTAQTGHNIADWQEEAYQKIQSMKEAYFAELHEFHQKISLKIQQPDALPHGKQSENFEKLKNFKMALDKMVAFLQIPKHSITLALKEKLPQYEKQILNMLSSNRRQKVAPPHQQGQQQFQHPAGHAQSTQHHPSQVLQVQPQENHGNQVQQINMPGSLTNMQSAGVSSMQHGSVPLSSLTAPATQSNITNAVQSGSDLDSVQMNSFVSLQQGSMGSVQQNGLGPLQNSISTAQQSNLSNLPQSSMSAMQPNNALQNTNALQQQHLKQQQQELMMQNPQLKQQLQQRQIQQQILQQQRQQLMQPQLHQQQKQQQSSQMSVHQMSQHHPLNELNELKARQGPGIKAGVYQPPYAVGQRQNYYHQQLKPGASFPISSPQNLQASSPQISHHSSPQIDQHSLLPTYTKAGTPMQSTGSPFVVPSPSTPIAPSPIPGDSEKLVSAAISHQSAGQTNQQAASGPPQAQAISVATPGISASPLLAECTSQEGALPSASTLSRANASERPLERLIKAVQSLSPKALTSTVCDITSVVSMIDRIAGSAPGNGSRAAVGEDLVAMTKCRLQARNFMSQDGGATVKKMKRHTSAMPLNNVSSAVSVNDNFMNSSSLDSSETESTATSHVKRQKLEANRALQEEIREINQQLIDTVVSICDEDSDALTAASKGGEGIIIKCSFNPVAFSPSLKAHFASMHMSPIAPLRLLLPANYPKSSPLLVDKLLPGPSKELEDLYSKAKSRFCISLRCLSQPMSLGEMAGTWDACARKVIVEYAQQTGGGSFSTTYGAWENCVGA